MWPHYLQTLRELCEQILTWVPKGVERRDKLGCFFHQLYCAIGLPIERFVVQVHYLCSHYTQRILRHGNLLSLSSEGGEHIHQPHKALVKNHRCHPGNLTHALKLCVEHDALKLALWKEDAIKPLHNPVCKNPTKPQT